MRKSRLSWNKQARLIELFVAGSTARTAAVLIGVNKTTASYYFQRLRQLIYEHCEEAGFLEGEVEIDESYFGCRRKGKRGRGAVGKDAGIWAAEAQWQGFHGCHTRCQSHHVTAYYSGESEAG